MQKGIELEDVTTVLRQCLVGLWLVLLVLLSACTAVDHSPEQSGSVQQPLQLKAKPKPQTLHELLYRAEQALQEDRLMKPKGSSAFDYYMMVLARQPLHQEARQGLDKISDRYLALAEQAWMAEDVTRAELMLQRAQQVTATPQQVKALRARFKEPVFASNEYRVSRRDLLARNTKARQRLADIASLAKAANSRMVIIAASDDEGRWMYQQMRVAVPGYRLRGNIDVGRFPRVILLDADG
jgi:hypothetical protein